MAVSMAIFFSVAVNMTVTVVLVSTFLVTVPVAHVPKQQHANLDKSLL